MDDARSGLAAALMLGGGLRPSPLGYSISRSPLDLEIRPGLTVAQQWVRIWRSVPSRVDMPIRCLVARGAPRPESLETETASHISIDIDQREFCGPAGAVRDAVAGMSPDDVIAVNEAATFPAASLLPFLESHFLNRAEATVAANPDGSPAGVYLFRAGLFRDVSGVGFTDLKEQFLDRLRTRGVDIRAHRLERPGVVSLRTRSEFLRAARIASGKPERDAGSVEPAWLSGERSATDDSVLSASASVDARARVVSSVIMTGATVEAGAIVVRSIVCEGVRVREGARVVDTVVTPEGARNDAWASARARWRQKA